MSLYLSHLGWFNMHIAVNYLRVIPLTILDVIFEVKQRYYDVLLAESQLEVQKESVRLLEEELQNEQNRFNAGDVSEFNVLRAEVELANSKTPLIRARNDVPLSEEELKRVIGVEEGSPLRQDRNFVLEGELRFKPVQISLEQAQEAAKTQRPELKRLRILIESAEEGVDVEWADYLPGLDAKGSYNVEKSRFTDEVDETFEGWRARLELNWKIFDSFNTKSRVEQARLGVQIAKTNLREQTLDIEVEVKRTHSSLVEAAELVSVSQKIVDRAKESLRLARNRVNAGVGIQIDVLDSRVALTEAGSNRVQALRDYNVAVAATERVMGMRSSPKSP